MTQKTTPKSYVLGWFVTAGRERFWFDADLWDTIPESEKLDFLTELLRSRTADGLQRPLSAMGATSGFRVSWPVTGSFKTYERKMMAQEIHTPRYPQIRGMNSSIFRSGEWARIIGVSVAGYPPRVCFDVEFLDGETDQWPVEDQAAEYECRPSINQQGR